MREKMTRRQRRQTRWQRIRTFLAKRQFRSALWLLETVFAAVAVYGVLNLGFWLEDSYTFKELSRTYEESEMFFRQVDKILNQKIDGQQNTELFEEEDGSFASDRQIDIRTYGDASTSVQDLNTTYCLSDLLEFAENGGRARMHSAILSAQANQNTNGLDAGEILDEQASELETILPVTGISLSECARWYSNPTDYVLEVYQLLDEVSEKIYEQYQQYTQQQDASWSSAAPSNLYYYIENTSSGEIYTNTGADSLEGAKAAAAGSEYVNLYQGERSFNVMIVEQEAVLNQDAADWFKQERFVNANEKVYLAVNLSYPVSDELSQYAQTFATRESVIWRTLAIIIVSAAVCLSAALYLLTAGIEAEPETLSKDAAQQSIWQTAAMKQLNNGLNPASEEQTPDGTDQTAGFSFSFVTDRKQKKHAAALNTLLDSVPVELAIGSPLLIAMILCFLFRHYMILPSAMTPARRMLIASLSAGIYVMILLVVFTLLQRIRSKNLWNTSIVRIVFKICSQAASARAASGQLLFFFTVYAVINLGCMLLGNAGFFLLLFLDIVVLLYLLRDMADKQIIYEGLRQISTGRFDYRIDTSSMLPDETNALAQAVNRMGDGLEQAVDAIVKNERMKAELITNVSHDIKTPLTSIINYVELLKREHLEGERVQHYIEVLDQKSRRLKQLTEDLLEISRITSGNVELQMIKIRLQSMLMQAVGEYQERLEEHGLTLNLDMEKEPLLIMADGRQFWRVLENLLSNICKYAKEQTAVVIRLHRAGSEAELCLENLMPEALSVAAEELTGRFVRGDRSRHTEGSGLGLSIAQNLVTLQGGTFHLEADETTFRAILTFPLVQEI